MSGPTATALAATLALRGGGLASILNLLSLSCSAKEQGPNAEDHDQGAYNKKGENQAALQQVRRVPRPHGSHGNIELLKGWTIRF